MVRDHPYLNSPMIQHQAFNMLILSSYLMGSSQLPEELSKGDMSRVIKCLLDLLAQRVVNVPCLMLLWIFSLERYVQNRAADNRAAYSSLRMTSMHRTASDSAASFEREVNLQKSRFVCVLLTYLSNLIP